MTAPAWDPLTELAPEQRALLDDYAGQLSALTRRVNLISPASAAEVEERHLVHSLALSYREFPAGSTVVDWGAGGGLPSIPLAVRFPDVQFVAVDAVGKKAEAVRLFARRLALLNLEVWTGRAQEWPGLADYAVSRAAAPLADLWRWYSRVARPVAVPPAGSWRPGLVCLKGGDLGREVQALLAHDSRLEVEMVPLGALLQRPYFEGKHIVVVSRVDDGRLEVAG